MAYDGKVYQKRVWGVTRHDEISKVYTFKPRTFVKLLSTVIHTITFSEANVPVYNQSIFNMIISKHHAFGTVDKMGKELLLLRFYHPF
jgi:hypothetical protein